MSEENHELRDGYPSETTVVSLGNHYTSFLFPSETTVAS
jgi:hypothetical protein